MLVSGSFCATQLRYDPTRIVFRFCAIPLDLLDHGYATEVEKCLKAMDGFLQSVKRWLCGVGWAGSKIPRKEGYSVEILLTSGRRAVVSRILINTPRRRWCHNLHPSSIRCLLPQRLLVRRLFPVLFGFRMSAGRKINEHRIQELRSSPVKQTRPGQIPSRQCRSSMGISKARNSARSV